MLRIVTGFFSRNLGFRDEKDCKPSHSVNGENESPNDRAAKLSKLCPMHKHELSGWNSQILPVIREVARKSFDAEWKSQLNCCRSSKNHRSPTPKVNDAF